MLDSVDTHIVAALQANARTSNADIARDLEMAPSAILERIRKLEQRGVITGYEARLSPRALDLGLTAFLFVQADETNGAVDIASTLAAIPEVLEVHTVAGEDCFLLKLRARDTDDLSRILKERVKRIAHVRQTRTTIVLSTQKESTQLPIPVQATDAQETTR